LFWFAAGGLLIALTGITGLFIPTLMAYGRIEDSEEPAAPIESLSTTPQPVETPVERQQ
jgi:hypothetical protein